MKRPASFASLMQLAFVAGTFAPALAHADRAYLFPMERRAGEQTLTPEVIGEAHDGVRNGLESADVTILEEALLQGELATCAVDRCAERIAATLRVDYTVYLAIWPAQQGHQPEIIVGIASAERGTYIADCRVGANDESPCARTSFAEAARLATERAVAKYMRGPGPWLVVEGTPQNAAVLIDGTEVGRTPDRFRVEPGDHEVTLELDDYESQTHVVNVEPGPSSEATLEFGLRPASHGLSVLTWLAIGSWIAAAGVAVVPIVRLAQGTIIEEVPPWGVREREPNAVVGIWFGGAAALAVAGVTFLVIDLLMAPDTSTANTDPFTLTF